MKKYWYVLLMMCCMIALPACDDDDDEDVAKTYKEWREENDQFMRKIAADPAYAKLEVPSKMGNIYVKVITEGEGTERIYYNSKVKVYYRGTLIDGTEFDSALPPYKDPAVFIPINDSSISGATSVIDGFGAALQYMKAGDKWNVWIPQELAYGSTGSQRNNVYVIYPYSAINFEIEVLEIVKD